jgi:predicted transcriptional regulator of viral defense system
MKLSRRLATGPTEAHLLTELERSGVSVFATGRHRRLVPDLTERQLRDTVHQLAKKGWLRRIEAGKYLVVPRAARGGWSEHPFVVASGIAPPEHYVSFWAALSHHGLTEQLPRVVHVALRERQKAAVTFQEWTYRFVSMAERKFFGFGDQEFSALNGAARIMVPIAEPEKAIVDALDQEALAGGISEVIKALRRGVERRRLTMDRLLEYTRRFGSAAVAARLGYLLERLDVPEAADFRPLVRRRGPPPALSTARGDAPALFDRDWYLNVNVPAWQWEEEQAG